MIAIERWMSDGLWQSLEGASLEVNEEREFTDRLDGMSMFLDAYNNIHVKVEELLLNATPVPTLAPTPTPFRFEPQPVERRTA